MSGCPFHQAPVGGSSSGGGDSHTYDSNHAADQPQAQPPAAQQRVTSKISLDEDEFECPVCLRLLFSPSSLPCGHTFCGPCLAHASTRTEPSEGNPSQLSCRCPICRTESIFDELPRPNALIAALIAKHLPEAAARRKVEADRDEAEERQRFSITRRFRVCFQPSFYGKRAFVIATEGQSRCPMSRGGSIPLGFYVALIDVRLPRGSVPPFFNYRPPGDEFFCSFPFKPPSRGDGEEDESSTHVAKVILHFQPRFQIPPREVEIAIQRLDEVEETSIEVEFDGRLVHN
mmetsp:Transcript_21826/g.47658  ORF Transcript_21826/g.47658 Transcript_21826/m.47658 type:complete len:288 (+) Transcript_21826:62-925(+)